MSLSLQLDVLLAGGLAAGRILTFLMTMPVLGMRSIPAPMKIGLALWLAWAVTPLLAEMPAVPFQPAPVAIALAGEFLVGLLLSFTVVLVFATVQMAGQIVGVQMAFSIVNVVDPQTQAQVSALSQIYFLMAVLIFVAMDGPLMVVHGITASFQALPPGTIGPAFAGGMAYLVGQVGVLFVAALRIGAPPVVALLLVSMVMGILGRTVPQLNILVVGFPLKILVGLLILALGAPYLGDAMIHAFEGFELRILGIAEALAGGR